MLDSISAPQARVFQDRRERSFDEHFDNLSDRQVEKVYALGKVGFVLYFVRNDEDGRRLAIMRMGDELAAVNYLGEIEFDPKVKLRDAH